MQATIRGATDQTPRTVDGFTLRIVIRWPKERSMIAARAGWTVTPSVRHMHFNLTPDEALLKTIMSAVNQRGYGGRRSPT